MKLRTAILGLILIALTGIGLAQAPKKAVAATIRQGCTIDMYYVLDLSASMDDPIQGGGGTKLQVLKSTLQSINQTILQESPSSRIGAVGFFGSENYSGNPEKPYPGQAIARPLTSNINQLNTWTTNLRSSDGTPLPLGVDIAKIRMDNEWNRTSIPVMVLISDGVPTIDREDYAYTAANVSAVNIRRPNGQYYTSAQVKQMGAAQGDPYPHGRKAGVPLGESMDYAGKVNNILKDGAPKQVKTFGLFLRGNGGSQDDNPQIVEYFADTNNSNSFYNVTNASQLSNDLTTLLGGVCGAGSNSNTATMTIDLAPYKILTPKQFKFSDDVYTFSGPPENLTVSGGNGPQTVAIEKIDQDQGVGGDARGQYYRITVANIAKKRIGMTPIEQTKSMFADLIPVVEEAYAYAPPPATNLLAFRRPYPFRLTFQQPVLNNDFESVVSYVGDRGAKDNVFFGNGSCLNDGSRAYLCIKELVTVTNPDTSEIRLSLNQKIELKGVYVAGNIAAPVQIQNIRLSPNAIAVGGSFSNVSGILLNQYLAQTSPTSELKWANIDDQILALYDKRTRGTTLARNAFPAVWYLNTGGDNPAQYEAPTTFTNQPEGRLWNVNAQNNFTFQSVDFRGQGTVVVNGNVTFNGPITCSEGKRVGVIVRGNITFNDTHIDCGAYVALGSGNAPGNITFTGEPPVNGDSATAIFVAKNNILIPNALSSPYIIQYDAAFAQKPTVLFNELLQILLKASS